MKVLSRLVPLCLTMLLLAGCFFDKSWHQKLTVVIETPSGEVSGSSVVRAGWRSDSKIILRDLDRGHFTLTGEALAVEVMPGRWLFLLLPGQDRLFYALLGKRGEGIEDTIPAIRAQRDPLLLSPTLYPQMVTFDDIADPKSVRHVDPADLATTFGPGVALKAVTLEVTGAPVTKGRVEAVLGWLGPYPEPALWPGDGRTTNIPFAMKIHHGDFIRRPQ
jgi:hypothetical protein